MCRSVVLGVFFLQRMAVLCSCHASRGRSSSTLSVSRECDARTGIRCRKKTASRMSCTRQRSCVVEMRRVILCNYGLRDGWCRPVNGDARRFDAVVHPYSSGLWLMRQAFGLPVLISFLIRRQATLICTCTRTGELVRHSR